MNRSAAACTAILSTIAAWVAVAVLTQSVDLPSAVPPGRENRAAIAIRDDVSAFQKWGSRQFTHPWLHGRYASARYFTQTSVDDRRADFLAALDDALESFDAVDLYLLAHDNGFVHWVAELPEESRSRLRLVYNTGCGDLDQGPAWLALGTETYVGHPGVSASPVFYFHFLRRWVRGDSLPEAMTLANRRMEAALRWAETLSFGRLDAAAVVRDSAASAHGNESLSFTQP